MVPYPVTVTSLDYGELKNIASPCLEIYQEEMPVHSAWAEDPDLKLFPGADDIGITFRQYYRILVFRRR